MVDHVENLVGVKGVSVRRIWPAGGDVLEHGTHVGLYSRKTDEIAGASRGSGRQ